MVGAGRVALFGIYNTALTLITQIAMLGMRSSSVREIASTGDSPSPQAVIIKKREAMELAPGVQSEP